MPLQVPTGAETGLPLFAQPVNASPMSPVSRRVEAAMPRSFAGIVAVVAIIALIGAARRDHAQTTGRTTTNTNTTRTTLESQNSSAENDTSASRRPLSFYTGTVRSSMFNAPAPPAPPKPKPVKVKRETPKPTPKPVPPPIPVPPVVINPFADWSYTGTIKMGDRTLALLENSKTNEGQYVSAGESFMGADIASITDQQVTLMAGGKPTMLAKSDNITVKQLDRPAPVAAPAAPANAAVPQQGGMPQGMITATATNGPMVVLPNGRTMTGDRAQRRARFMNRNFNR